MLLRVNLRLHHESSRRYVHGRFGALVGCFRTELGVRRLQLLRMRCMSRQWRRHDEALLVGGSVRLAANVRLTFEVDLARRKWIVLSFQEFRHAILMRALSLLFIERVHVPTGSFLV